MAIFGLPLLLIVLVSDCSLAHTCTGPQPDSAQEDIAGQGLLVPHGELQAHIVEVSWLQTAVGESVIPMRVDRATLHRRLVLCGLLAVREQVTANSMIQRIA